MQNCNVFNNSFKNNNKNMFLDIFYVAKRYFCNTLIASGVAGVCYLQRPNYVYFKFTTS